MPWSRFLPEEFHPQLDLGQSPGRAHQPQPKALGTAQRQDLTISCSSHLCSSAPPAVDSNPSAKGSRDKGMAEIPPRREHLPWLQLCWHGWDWDYSETKINNHKPWNPWFRATLTVDKGTTNHSDPRIKTPPGSAGHHKQPHTSSASPTNTLAAPTSPKPGWGSSPGSPRGLGGFGAVWHSLYCSGAWALSEDHEKGAAGHMAVITHSSLCLQSILSDWQHSTGGSSSRRRGWSCSAGSSWSCRASQDIGITQSQLGRGRMKPRTSSPCPPQCLKFVKWTENGFCVRTLRQVKSKKTEPGIQQESAKEISSTAETESSFP